MNTAFTVKGVAKRNSQGGGKKQTEKITVLTYGTFDLFHYGHYFLLKRARALGDSLIVGVSSDKLCDQKGKMPVFGQDQRMRIIKDLKFVNRVIIENSMAQKVDDAKKYGAKIFVLGDDYAQTFPQMPEYNQLKEIGCETVFLPRTPNISTTAIKSFNNIYDKEI